MDTKWKNIKEKCMKMIETVRENRHGIIGGIYMAAGTVILIAMFGSFQRMYTWDILLVGGVMNLLLVIAQTQWLQAVRRMRERKGDGEVFLSQAAGENYENYYAIWAERKAKQEKRLNAAAVLLLIA